MTTLADFFGYDPARIVWKIVRGDTASIQIDFLENDEVTGFDISGWNFISIAYNPRADEEYELETEITDTGVLVTATSDVTAEWGSTYGSVVAELLFDLQVDTGSQIWTPVVGTITVIGDVGGSL
jgi:hypothetical protein